MARSGRWDVLKLLHDSSALYGRPFYNCLTDLGVFSIEDLQELTSEDLLLCLPGRHGSRLKASRRIAAELDRRKLPHRVQPGALASPLAPTAAACAECCRTCQDAHLKLLQAARLDAHSRMLTKLGVRRWSDLYELTGTDFNATGMRLVQCRRLWAAMNATWGSSPPTPPSRAQLTRSVAPFLHDAAAVLSLPEGYFRFDEATVVRLKSRHGLREVPDLFDLTTDDLRDVGAPPLHIRRFELLRPALAHESVAPFGCASSVASFDRLLAAARLSEHTRAMADQIGVTTAADLLQLDRGDLVALGLLTLPRRRIEAVQRQLRKHGCRTQECNSSTCKGTNADVAALRASRRREFAAATVANERVCQGNARAKSLKVFLAKSRKCRHRAMETLVQANLGALASRAALSPREYFEQVACAVGGTARQRQCEVAPWSPRLEPLELPNSTERLECAAGQLRLPDLPPQRMCLVNPPLFRNGDQVKVGGGSVLHLRSGAHVQRKDVQFLRASSVTYTIVGIREVVGEAVRVGPNGTVVFTNVPTDHLSRKIAETGRWRDCEDIVDAWQQAEGSADDSIFLDVGANIGACTIEVLLRTRARVLAFEPHPRNLWHLTRSLRKGTAETLSDAGWASRVAVFPMGLGDLPERRTISVSQDNSGDARLGRADASEPVASSADAAAPLPIRVQPLDSLLPRVAGQAPIRLMKLDVQGFECKVIKGALQLLMAGTVQTIIAELSEALLLQHECSAFRLKRLLTRVGFNIVRETRVTRAEWLLVARLS